MVPSGMKTFNAIGWKNPDWIIKKKYVPNMIKYRYKFCKRNTHSLSRSMALSH